MKSRNYILKKIKHRYRNKYKQKSLIKYKRDLPTYWDTARTAV